MTVVSASIRFVPIFEEVPWGGGVKRQYGNRKRGFSRLSTLRLRQHCSFSNQAKAIIQ